MGHCSDMESQLFLRVRLLAVRYGLKTSFPLAPRTTDAINAREYLVKSIETNRLLLRNFSPEDASDLFDYLHEPRASCFLSERLEDMVAAHQEVSERGNSDDYVAVCLKSTNQLIGDLFAICEDDPDTFSVGWNFNARFGGAGLATEAA